MSDEEFYEVESIERKRYNFKEASLITAITNGSRVERGRVLRKMERVQPRSKYLGPRIRPELRRPAR
jgi:hypothetical protein